MTLMTMLRLRDWIVLWLLLLLLSWPSMASWEKSRGKKRVEKDERHEKDKQNRVKEANVEVDLKNV